MMSVGDDALLRVRDQVRPMSPPPAAGLSEAEIATLDAWVEADCENDERGCTVGESAQ